MSLKPSTLRVRSDFEIDVNTLENALKSIYFYSIVTGSSVQCLSSGLVGSFSQTDFGNGVYSVENDTGGGYLKGIMAESSSASLQALLM